MAQNQTADWYPQQTGNTQYDENQRKVWENLYYLRDRNNNAIPSPAMAGGLSGTAFFAGGFTMTSGPTGKTYYRMIIQEGRIVGIS